MSDTEALPVESELALIKEQLAAVQTANDEQQQALAALQKSDAHQYRLLRFQRKIQSACIAAFGIAVAIGFAGFSDGNREALEKVVVGIVGAAAAGHVGSNFVDKMPEQD